VLGSMHFFNMFVLHLLRRPLKSAVPSAPYQPSF
jgi:hypothetical protein